MDYSTKRKFSSEDFDKLEYCLGKSAKIQRNRDETEVSIDYNRLGWKDDGPLGNAVKDQMNSPKTNTNDDDKEGTKFSYQQLVYSESNGIEKSFSEEQKQVSTTRREINRQRAKDFRMRKKIMVEEMQRKISLLTVENKRLRLESQMQQEESNQLRKMYQLLVSEKKYQTGTSVPPVYPTRSRSPDILKVIDSFIGDANTCNRRERRHPEYIKDCLRHSALPSSIASDVYQILGNKFNPFGF